MAAWGAFLLQSRHGGIEGGAGALPATSEPYQKKIKRPYFLQKEKKMNRSLLSKFPALLCPPGVHHRVSHCGRLRPQEHLGRLGPQSSGGPERPGHVLRRQLRYLQEHGRRAELGAETLRRSAGLGPGYQQRQPGLRRHCTNSVAVSPSDANLVIAGDAMWSPLWRSTDGGDTWTCITLGADSQNGWKRTSVVASSLYKFKLFLRGDRE